MGKSRRSRTTRLSQRGGRRLAGLGLAGGLIAASVFAMARPTAEAAPNGLAGPAHMNPTSWNPTDDNEPFESSGPYAFDTRMPDASRTGSVPRTGIGSFEDACRRINNTWAPIEPAYLTWRVKVESTDDYFAAEPEIDKLSFFLSTTHGAVTRGLAGVPKYDTRTDPLRKYDMYAVLLREMVNTGGGIAPLFPDVGIPWEHWDSAWDNLSQAHDEVVRVCPSR